jgi:cytochrome P450
VGSSAFSIHHDTTFYEDPSRYNPFRFSEPRERTAQEALKVESEGGFKKELENAVAKDKTSSMNQTTETFLAWGHGRKACPGRYFATDVLRLMIAAMVKDYDIEPLAARPKNKWLLDTIMPPAGAKIRVRRRVEA